MKKHVIIRFLIFFILFAGAVEAKPVKENEKDNSITLFGAFNTFSVSSCSTTDKYIQGSVGAKYDRKLDDNVSMHVSGTYARSKRISHEQNADESDDCGVNSDNLERIYNSGMGSMGVSYNTKYFRMRTDFMLSMWKEHFNEEPGQFKFRPMGGLLIEAGKMDKFWVSTGIYHPEYPFGLFQGAINGKGKHFEFSLGAVFGTTNITTWKFNNDSPLSLFIRYKVQINNTLALNSLFTLKPISYDIRMMFESSLGMEFRF